ncbi:MAG: hypothetical protein H0T43_11630, partial [Solirubrobacterales bacterium]|nr:hypothetical protein [Solirubrobacterales bacterium]
TTGATRRLQPRTPGPSATEPSGRAGSGSGRARRLTAAFVVLAILVVPVAIGGYIASQSVYFVGTDDDGFVTMYRGLPWELPAGLELYSVNYVSGVRADAVPDLRRRRLLDHSLRSRDDAADLVRELERGRLAS